ncbi:MAG: alpha-amylase family glycosyl hydrolase [Anaerolineales bacterium]
MDDLIFGTLATDELKLVHYRTTRQGVRHGNHILPPDPLPGQPVKIRVQVGSDLEADHVACYYTLDGSPPRGSRGRAPRGQVVNLTRVKVDWDTFTWGYVSRWEGEILPQAEGTKVCYRISAWSDGGREIYADWPDVKRTVDRAAEAFFHNRPLPEARSYGDPDEGQTFAYRVDRLRPPQWAREAVIYHIFVDRFFPGEGRDWRKTRSLRGRFGGTLWGLAEKMGYISDLGATVIWLSPLFPSPTVHGYNATDYYHVEEELGGEDALREVIDQAHRRGIRVILDLVCNHVSHHHPYFREAWEDPSGPYRDWFYFDEDEDIGYRTFFGVRDMPQVNLDHPGARDWMLDVARYWLETFDVDGYRLDHANGPQADFWSDFYAVCKEAKADSFCFGEVVEPPDVQRQYIGRLDGLLDFQLCDALRHTYGRKNWQEERFQSMLSGHRTYFPDHFLMPTFLDNHDMDRFLFIAGGEKSALRSAARVQFRQPAPPIIYYGTEVGLEQTVSKSTAVGLEASRGPMIWGDEQDQDLLHFYQELIQERFKARPWQDWSG